MILGLFRPKDKKNWKGAFRQVYCSVDFKDGSCMVPQSIWDWFGINSRARFGVENKLESNIGEPCEAGIGASKRILPENANSGWHW